MIEIGVVIGIITNVLCTVGIVLGNKYVYQTLGFRYMVFLSGCHFAFTYLCLKIMLMFKFFKAETRGFLQVLPVAAGSLGSVAFMNLNLAHNSVGFYQISKLLCIPVTLVFQYVMYDEDATTPVKWALCLVIIGVGIATVSDVSLNLVGSLFAAAAICATTLGQIFTQTLQKELQLDHMQLLYLVSPIISSGMFIISPVFDDVFGSSAGSLIHFQMNPTVASGIIMTCVLSVGVNISNYMIIGKTGPLTYQVVGHAKTCLILVLGFVVFEYPVVPKNVMGISVAVLGMIAYGEAKRREQLNVAEQLKYSRVSSVDENDSEPLVSPASSKSVPRANSSPKVKMEV